MLDAHSILRHGPDLAPGRGGAMGRDMGQIRTINDAGIDNAVPWWRVQGAQSKWSDIDTPALPPSPTGQHQGLRLSLRRMVPRTPGDASLGASVHVLSELFGLWGREPISFQTQCDQSKACTFNPVEARDIEIPQRINDSFVFVANPHLYSVINHLVEFDFSD